MSGTGARRARPHPVSRRWRYTAALAVGVGVSALYGLYSARQWARFEVPSWDLGIFTQLLRAYAEGRAPVVPIKGEGFLLLGDHFHPLLVVLAPISALWPSGLTLLMIQAACVGISAGILTACAVRHLGGVAGTLIGGAYGLSWGLQSAVHSQFHEVALALPLLAASCSALLRDRHRAAALWALPLIGLKEDLGLTVAMLGVVIAVRGSRRLGAVLAVAGVVAFVLTTAVILPALNPDGVWDYAQDSILSVLLSDPGAALARLGTGWQTKALTLVLVVAITGMLALFSPLVLMVLPTLAWRMTSDVAYHWNTDWHYSAILMVVVFAATIDAIARRPRWAGRARLLAGGLLMIALVVTAWFPLARLTQPQTYQSADHHDGAHAALALIEDDAVVISDLTLLAYLAPRAQVYWLGSPGAPVPDYVVIDRNSSVHRGPPEDVAVFAAERFGGDGWRTVLDQDGMMVARRGG